MGSRNSVEGLAFAPRTITIGLGNRHKVVEVSIFDSLKLGQICKAMSTQLIAISWDSKQNIEHNSKYILQCEHDRTLLHTHIYNI